MQIRPNTMVLIFSCLMLLGCFTNTPVPEAEGSEQETTPAETPSDPGGPQDQPSTVQSDQPVSQPEPNRRPPMPVVPNGAESIESLVLRLDAAKSYREGELDYTRGEISRLEGQTGGDREERRRRRSELAAARGEKEELENDIALLAAAIAALQQEEDDSDEEEAPPGGQ